MVMVRARGDFGASGNAPLPIRLASRVLCAPTSHQLGMGVRSFTMSSLKRRVSSEIASGRNSAGSSWFSVFALASLIMLPLLLASEKTLFTRDTAVKDELF